MLPALVLASWWAQAEPAPAEPGSAPRVAAAPLPAPEELDNRLSVTVGYGRRLGDEGGAIGPRNGFGVGASYQRRVAELPADFDVWAGVDFLYDKFQTSVAEAAAPGATPGYAGERIVSQTSFAPTAGASWRWRRLRPFAQLGAGVTIAYFSTPETALSPGTLTATQPLARGTAGLTVAITHDIGVVVRASYTHLFNRPTLTTTPSSGPPATISFLGDLFDAGAGVVLGF